MPRRSMVLVIVGTAAVGTGGYIAYRAFVTHQVSQETPRLAQLLMLEPTSRIADVGAGGGDYSFELASTIVPSGHVFATEIDNEAIEALRARATAGGFENVTILHGGEDSTNLPVNCCDAAFLRGVYHHIIKPAQVNASLLMALRPGGRLAIIDFEPSWFLSTFFPVQGVQGDRGGHGVAAAVVVNELEQAGFTLISRDDRWTRGQFCLVFRKAA